MKIKIRLFVLFSVLALLGVGQSVRAQLSLTGIVLYSTDAAGNYYDDGWNTQPSDFAYNLWVSSNGVPLNGPSDALAAVSFSLTPGTYTFSVAGETGRGRAYHAIDLYFNGQTDMARISVYAPTATDTSVTSFRVNQSGMTPNIDFTVLKKQSAGTNLFSSGGMTVTLTGFRWEYAGVEGQDLVGKYTRAPSGNPDNQGIFTLTVSNAPVRSISGVLKFEGGNNAAQNVTFTCRPTDGSANIVQTASVPASGVFSLPGLPQKPYTLHIKGDKYLAVNVPVDLSGGNVSGVIATLPAGDANNDNTVDTSDFNILAGAFGSSSSISGNGYDAQADFNGDGMVDTSDFNLLVGNFGNSGDL